MYDIKGKVHHTYTYITGMEKSIAYVWQKGKIPYDQIWRRCRSQQDHYTQRLKNILYEWIFFHVKKQTPKFIPNIRHFMLRASGIFHFEHLNIFHSEHQSLFVSDICHFMLRTSCNFPFRTSDQFSFRTPGKPILYSIVHSEHLTK